MFHFCRTIHLSTRMVKSPSVLLTSFAQSDYFFKESLEVTHFSHDSMVTTVTNYYVEQHVPFMALDYPLVQMENILLVTTTAKNAIYHHICARGCRTLEGLKSHIFEDRSSKHSNLSHSHLYICPNKF